MVIVSIKGLTDGKYPVEAAEEVSAMEYVAPEFFGTVSITGTLRKHGKRYLMDISAQAPAKLLCDVSGEEFEETIQASFSLEYIANTMLANLNADKTDLEPPFYIREDDTTIDITDEVRQELSISLPMRRIAPQYRDKDFEQVFPQFSENAAKTNADGEPETDPRWAALKSIKFDT
ncbi:MAG: DUF177 domain-containing protein [Candidatus Kapabacteria bacterium]|jgi:uncharacterized metal-binding protein YceD (DUF177 family)|nr:DUF177 domain-containing protein [Candidatus Kapabacteria bacterium]